MRPLRNEDNDSGLLREFSEEKPFGPAATRSKIGYDYSHIYFPTERFERAASKRYTIILGRRGSGKSSLIQRILHGKEFRLHIQLDKSELLGVIKMTLTGEDTARVPVERIAAAWTNLFWVSLFVRVAQLNPQESIFPKVQSLLKAQGYLPHDTASVSLLEWLNGRARDPEWKANILPTFGSPLENQSEVSFIQARDEVLGFLKSTPTVILLDSKERYPSDSDDERHIISGLLKSVGDFGQAYTNLHMKCFFPAEIYPYLKAASDNYAKDFENHIVLHWNAKELFGMICKRIELFFKLHNRDNQYSEFHKLHREHLKAVWYRAFPKRVSNQYYPVIEESIAYILRHTQLLPRQAILLCNKIAENHRDSILNSGFDEKTVRAGVRTAERQISTEIASAFKSSYETAEVLLSRYLKHLPVCHNLAAIDRLKARIDAHDFAEYKADPEKLSRMFCELGIVGKQLLEDGALKDRYVRAEYEYSLPEHLAINESDTLVLHPIFLQTYGVPIDIGNCDKPILPRGADLDESADF